MSIFICRACGNGAHCVLITVPNPLTKPEFCNWGEGLTPSKWELFDEKIKPLEDLKQVK
jgi:hypothetical protein